MRGTAASDIALPPPAPEAGPAGRPAGRGGGPRRRLFARLADDAVPAGACLAAILLGGAALRIAVGFFAGLEWFTPDSRNYLRMADGILAGEPIAFFANGYPLLIAGVKSLAPAPAVPAVLIGLNAAAATASIALVYALALGIGGRRVPALAAALCQAVYPNQLVYMHYVLTESIATALVLGALLSLCRRREGLGGLLLAVAVAFRSSLSPTLPLVGAVLVWRSGVGRALGRFAAGAALVGALYQGLVAAGAILPSDITRINLLFSINSTSTNFEFSNERFTNEEKRHPLRTYLRFAVEQPGAFALQRASSLWELWGPYPTDEDRAVGKRLLLGMRFPLLVLALVAVARGFRRWEVALLAIPLAVNSAIHVAFYSHPRYAYVTEPLVIVLAALV